MDELLARPKRREIRDIQIAPILDMLVAVIFFLLLSTSVFEFTKQTLPPAGFSTITEPAAPPPLNPKFFALQTRGELRLIIQWAGNEPGLMDKTLPIPDNAEISAELIKETAALVTRFKQKFPSESSVQLGFSPEVAYQTVISVMDGVRDQIPDMILVSYEDAQLLQSSQSNGT